VTAFARRVAALMGFAEEQLERLAGGDLSQVLVFRRPDGRCTVAKGGAAPGTEAAMLRALAGAGLPTPGIEGEYDGVLLLDHVENDGVFSPRAWASIGGALRKLHAHGGETYGWPVDYALGSVALDNRETSDWPRFWAERRLLPTVAVLDRPWRERIQALTPRLSELLPQAPRPALLHGDLWTGNILVAEGRLAALIDPACCHGHAEVDLAMLTLFDTPGESFWDAYGPLDPGWELRRPIYQLFPALTHLRLFGAGYAGLVERLLDRLDA
jgi:fructosamine-3-kinase